MSENIQEPQKKKTLFSGIQPSGTLTLGNYIGALRNFGILEKDYNCLFCVVDLHAITVRQDPAKLRKRCFDLAAIYLACGLNPEKSLIYCQSHVAAHSELAWILNCYTYMGELQRMTQYKAKSEAHKDNINSGLFTYPALMAADILLYQTDVVPVGVDQKQHLELTRDIAQRVNSIYSNVFTVPEPIIPKVGGKVMSLQEPEKKMSKSDPDDCYIALLDDANIIRKKIRRAVTDSETEIRFDSENKPGVSNLLSIISSLTGENIDSITASMTGKGYGYLKDTAADCVIDTLTPIQKEYSKYIDDKKYLQNILDKNAQTASYLANKTMRKLHKKIGLAPFSK